MLLDLDLTNGKRKKKNIAFISLYCLVPCNGVGGSDGGGKKEKIWKEKHMTMLLNKLSFCEHLQEEKESEFA